MTWVKVLPADPTKEVYFKELVGQTQMDFIHLVENIIAGPMERVFTQTLLESFPDSPRVVMLLNENGNVYGSNYPPNDKASKYYPNSYGLSIKGDAVLVGEQDVWVDGEPDRIFVDMPLKYRVIHEMETILADSGNDAEKCHSLLDQLLLSVVDPDVRKMYEEARDQFDWWM